VPHSMLALAISCRRADGGAGGLVSHSLQERAEQHAPPRQDTAFQSVCRHCRADGVSRAEMDALNAPTESLQCPMLEFDLLDGHGIAS